MSRLATLAQAMSNTIATAPKRAARIAERVADQHLVEGLDRRRPVAFPERRASPSDAWMPRSCSRARASDTPSRSRPETESQCQSRRSWSGRNRAASSSFASSRSNTPGREHADHLMRDAAENRPCCRMSAAPPKYVCHAAWLMTTTGSAPAIHVVLVKVRPSPPADGEHLEVVGGHASRVEPDRIAAAGQRDRLGLFGGQRLERRSRCGASRGSRGRSRAFMITRLGRSPHTRMMRSGWVNGSGESSTASTTLNIAALAPMPSASTPAATR